MELSISNFGSGAYMGSGPGGLKMTKGGVEYYRFGAHIYISSIQVDSYAILAWYCVIF